MATAVKTKQLFRSILFFTIKTNDIEYKLMKTLLKKNSWKLEAVTYTSS